MCKAEIELREFKLLVRSYFYALDLTKKGEPLVPAQDYEKKIRKELDIFTAREQAELPFGDPSGPYAMGPGH